MDDLKSVTVSYLRELAQKHLGSGYSKLKKEELIAALAAYVPALAKLAKAAGITVARKSSTVKRAVPDKKAVPAPEPRKVASTERSKAGAAKKTERVSAASSRSPAVPEKKAPRARSAASEPKDAPALKTSRTAAVKEKSGDKLGEGRVSAPKRVAAKRASEKPGAHPPARPAQVVTFPPKPKGSREPASAATPASPPPRESSAGAGAGSPAASTPAPEAPAAPAPPTPVVQHDAEPLVEGFFVARIAGEDEARRHHMVEDQARPTSPERPELYNERLGELPVEYGDDSALLLPRDPQTLFVSWDFSPAARNRALQGLESPRAVLRVFDGEKLAREQDCVLETRGIYIHGMQPGRPYRVEVHFVGRDGRTRRIGHSSSRVTLPPTGTSTDHTVRFLRVQAPRQPEPQPLPELVPPVRANAPEVEEREYITWRRVNLPGSAGVRDVPESRRERTPAAESHLESGPRAEGASDQRYMEAKERAPGASDQRYMEAKERAPGASDQRYMEARERAPGASDQRYQEGASRTGGAQAPHQYLDIGRAPGASDMRYLDSPGRAAGASDMRYLDSQGRVTGASDQRYLESPPRAPGASDMRYLEAPPRAPGASDQRYLESPPRAPGASDMRYLESPPRAPGASDMRYLESPPRAPGASDMRYFESPPRAPGASDERYFESPPRAPGASDTRYLESPPRAPGASDTRYLESPQRVPGASDQRYLEYVARPPGASDQRPADSAPRPPGSSEEPLPRKPPSGGDRS